MKRLYHCCLSGFPTDTRTASRCPCHIPPFVFLLPFPLVLHPLTVQMAGDTLQEKPVHHWAAERQTTITLTFTPTDSFEFPVRECFWSVGGRQRTQREPSSHRENMPAPHRRVPVPTNQTHHLLAPNCASVACDKLGISKKNMQHNRINKRKTWHRMYYKFNTNAGGKVRLEFGTSILIDDTFNQSITSVGKTSYNSTRFWGNLIKPQKRYIFT